MADTSPEYAMARIEKYTDRSNPRGCWIWTRAVNSNGYPEMHIKPRVVGVHRWLYQHVHGITLRRDQLCLHRCDTPRCVNPDSLVHGKKWKHLHRRLAGGSK